MKEKERERRKREREREREREDWVKKGLLFAYFHIVLLVMYKKSLANSKMVDCLDVPW